MPSSGSDRIKMPPGFWTGLQKTGIRPSDLTRAAGLPLTAIADSALPLGQYFAIWRTYAELTGDAAEAVVRMVGAFDTAQYPPMALAAYHARDYRDALQRMARYKRMCPPELLAIEEKGAFCTIELNWAAPEEAGPPVLTGTTLAFLLELGRRGTGKDITAQLVEFVLKPGDRAVLERYFGCAVQGGASSDRLTLRREHLDLPFVSYNEELLALLTPVLDRSLNEAPISAPSSTADKTKWIIKRSFTAGRPDMRHAARELGMSERTLQRRLSAESTGFNQLLNEARREQALEYLADPALDIRDIAFLVGYEDETSFYRAFRSWEGDTPANWRAGRQG
ncbi:AraC family transcriptional regulator [Saccharibacillus alkalitolerans]|uniref:AraC family transcriptional regulator n=1 Tax=Saccharibacillus alkalitolerans TaxID=2705290 RepID=A0ABX0FAR0_9BACL|nr:AraC family transcriptional regulator [Saccharibacillus alkalitolerans]NGZ76638.1 AraC family transcriptional regulator [Saccharibacillus alkalitolerans]